MTFSDKSLEVLLLGPQSWKKKQFGNKKSKEKTYKI